MNGLLRMSGPSGTIRRLGAGIWAFSRVRVIHDKHRDRTFARRPNRRARGVTGVSRQMVGLGEGARRRGRRGRGRARASGSQRTVLSNGRNCATRRRNKLPPTQSDLRSKARKINDLRKRPPSIDFPHAGRGPSMRCLSAARSSRWSASRNAAERAAYPGERHRPETARTLCA